MASILAKNQTATSTSCSTSIEMTIPTAAVEQRVTPSSQKLIILHERNIAQEQLVFMASIVAHVVTDLSLYINTPLDQLLKQFDIILIDMTNRDQLAYYDSYKSAISAECTVVYLKRVGRHLDIERSKKTLMCDFARKFMPMVYSSLDDLIKKLSSDHISQGIITKLKTCSLF